jgi:hypothetical protein
MTDDKHEITRPGDLLRNIKGALADGNALRAYELGRSALDRYPRDPEISHATVLALARASGPAKAAELFNLLKLHDVVKAGGSDLATVEIASLAARIMKDEALIESEPLKRNELLRAAAERYQAIYANTANIYPGINAATLWLLAGEKDRAQTLAKAIIGLIERLRFFGRAADYYASVSVAEAQLILDDLPAAKEALTSGLGASGAPRRHCHHAPPVAPRVPIPGLSRRDTRHPRTGGRLVLYGSRGIDE